ncbi:MAG TPA: TolC family protein [Limnochordales bacterium]
MTLAQAVAVAEEHNLDLRSARIAAEDARVALEQVQAAQLARPDPVALLQAQAAADLARRQLELARQQLRLRVAEDYFGVLRVENLIQVTQEGLTLAQRQLEVAREKFRAGVAAEVEVLRATGQVTDLRATLLQLEGNRTVALMRFRQTLGLPPDAPTRPAPQAVEPAPVEASLEQDLARALDERVEVLQARAALEAARKQAELSDNSYTPRLQLERAQLGVQRAETALQQAVNGVTLGVRQQYEAMQDAFRRLDVLRQRVQEAQETLRMTQRMYEASAATDVDLLSAQSALTRARTDYVHALFDYHLARLRYLQAVGRLNLAEGGARQAS